MTELRQMDKALYTWLYRNDREWLKKNLPAKKPLKLVNTRVDWNARDSEILEQVKEAVNGIWTDEGKPKRISISFVGSKIGKRSLLEKHLNKLPKTKLYLEYVKDNDRDYRIRRIKWAIKELENEGEDLQLWKIVRKAGIRKEYVADLEEEIIKLI